MELKKPKNSNYAAVVVEIKTMTPLENCNNVVATHIMGQQVIIGKDTNIGDIGLYFPVECQLSGAFLKNNNLYRNIDLNNDNTKKGYFDENGRVRCQKFVKHDSEGFFIPIDSLEFTGVDTSKFKLGQEFDEVNGVEICKKYMIKTQRTPGLGGNKNSKLVKKHETKLVENQFRLHGDTSMLYKNLHRIKPTDLISITYKIHGTSFISSKVICKKPLVWYEKILKKLGVNIVDTAYDYLYSSRKVIKNEQLNPNPNHYYGDDIWGIAHNEVKEFLLDGMTIYGEIAGFLPNGGAIQKGYDYGCETGQHKLFIYRVTYTNPSGKVFEFSAKQVQDWCRTHGVGAVPQLYYGYAKDIVDCDPESEDWSNKFLETVKAMWNEKDCYICQNKVPEEGAVIRIEGIELEAYKQKSLRFYERETKLLDKGESDIESEN